MKKLTRNRFESLQQRKFRTVEASELEKINGGSLIDLTTLATVTVTPTGSHTDAGDKFESTV